MNRRAVVVHGVFTLQGVFVCELCGKIARGGAFTREVAYPSHLTFDVPSSAAPVGWSVNGGTQTCPDHSSVAE